jgi:hypothetical protein
MSVATTAPFALRHQSLFGELSKSLSARLATPAALVRWFKLNISYIEFVAPQELENETGRLILLLAEYPLGLGREALLERFYPNYARASADLQESYRIRLEKLIQRSRSTFKPYQLSVQFCRQSKCYALVSTHQAGQ